LRTTTPRVVALLLVANTVAIVAGALALGGTSTHGIQRPIWLPPLWLRSTIPLAVAGGLWFEERWAWWIAVTMCAGLLLWTGVASFLLALGGYFSGDGVTLATLHLALLVATWLAAFGLLLSRSGRTIGLGSTRRITRR